MSCFPQECGVSSVSQIENYYVSLNDQFLQKMKELSTKQKQQIPSKQISHLFGLTLCVCYSFD